MFCLPGSRCRPIERPASSQLAPLPLVSPFSSFQLRSISSQPMELLPLLLRSQTVFTDILQIARLGPSCRGFGIAKILKKRQLDLRQGSHPVDVGSKSSVAGEKGS
jgi:hypothetical protein